MTLYKSRRISPNLRSHAVYTSSWRRLGYGLLTTLVGSAKVHRCERQYFARTAWQQRRSRVTMRHLRPQIFSSLVWTAPAKTIHLRLLLFLARTEFRARAHSDTSAPANLLCSRIRPLHSPLPLYVSRTCYAAVLHCSVSRIRNINQPKWSLSVSGTCHAGCRYCTGGLSDTAPGAVRQARKAIWLPSNESRNNGRGRSSQPARPGDYVRQTGDAYKWRCRFTTKWAAHAKHVHSHIRSRRLQRTPFAVIPYNKIQ